MNNHLHPDSPEAPSSDECIPVWMNPPNIVPANPDAVKIPLLFPNSRSVYHDPRI